jgi:hypothetical protein
MEHSSHDTKNSVRVDAVLESTIVLFLVRKALRIVTSLCEHDRIVMVRIRHYHKKRELLSSGWEMNDTQLDFGSLVIPSVESDPCASDATDHPALSRRNSSTKSIDSLGLNSLSEEDISPPKIQDAVDALGRFFENGQRHACKRQPDGELPCVVHQTQPVHVDGGHLKQGSDLPPPRRFYRRFWFGISVRLLKAGL